MSNGASLCLNPRRLFSTSEDEPSKDRCKAKFRPKVGFAKGREPAVLREALSAQRLVDLEKEAFPRIGTRQREEERSDADAESSRYQRDQSEAFPSPPRAHSVPCRATCVTVLRVGYKRA